MRTITNTHTGKIVTDTDFELEYLYVGDYGKENNIKASFLGYDKRIERVEHKEVVLTDKLVVTVSSQKGCPMKCNFCDCPKLGFRGNASLPELVTEIMSGIALSGIKHGKRLNVHFARMGEPTFNKDKCIVKITPIHKTVEATNEGYEIITDFDVYEKFEQPLVDAGWDVIVFIPSKEEDDDRITCGNALIALNQEK